MSTEISSTVRKFDLNIDKVLESWDPSHAIRELIANALDEQVLTNTADIKVYELSPNEWIIRDFGRGLSYEHLIQTENPEKIAASNTIGKFGVGLKDALATLWRHNIQTVITSRHGLITIERSSKHTFEDLLTLHACVAPPPETTMVGTAVRLFACPSSLVNEAKEMFLAFQQVGPLETTQYGQVLSNQTSQASIYLNGMRIASEANFLFSYNITSPNAAMKKALNRERMNVGRAAYSDRVKSTLLNCRGAEITMALAEDLQRLSSGNNHDELAWLEVQTHACNLLASLHDVVFVTAEERTQRPDLVEHAVSDGLRTITIPERLKDKVSGAGGNKDAPVRLLSSYAQSFNESFKYDFVMEERLPEQEKKVFQLTSEILELIGGKPPAVKEILISETMRPDEHVGFDADGVWIAATGQIIIKRSALSNREKFVGTLLHEIAHALSGASDISLQFENELTDLLGKVASVGISTHKLSLQSGQLKPEAHLITTGEKRTEAFYSRAKAYQGLGNYKDAIDEFSKAIELDPAYLQAYWGRGISRWIIGDKTGHLADYSQAVELDPTNAKTYFMRGLAHYRLGKTKEAIADYDRAIEISPGYLDAYCERGLAYRSGKKAIDDFDFVLAKKPDDAKTALELNPEWDAYFSGGLVNYFAEAHLGRGLAYHLDGDEQNAIVDFDKAIKLNPACSRAYNYRGLARYFAGDPDGSLNDLTKAIEVAPNQTGSARYFVLDLRPTRDCDNAYFNRAAVLYRLGDRKNFLEDLSKIEFSNRNIPHMAVNIFLGGIWHGVIANPKQPELAIPWFDMAINIDSNFSYAYYMRALARFDLKDTNGAMEDCKRASQIHATDDPSSLYIDGLLFGDATFHRQKEHFFLDAIARAYNLRGCINLDHFEGDEHELAQADFARAIALQPKYAEPYFNLGKILWQELGDDQKAEEYFTRAIELGLNSPRVYRERIICRYFIGNDHGVIDDTNQVTEAGAGDAETYYLRGLAYFRLGKIDWAENDFLRAAQLDVRGRNIDPGAVETTISKRVNYANAYAYWHRGYERYKKGDRQGAKLDYQEFAKFGYDESYYDVGGKWEGDAPWSFY